MFEHSRQKEQRQIFHQSTFVRELNGSGYFFSNGDHNRILLLHPSEKKIYLNMQVRKKNEILKPKDMELFKWKFIYSKKSFLKIKANVVDHPEALMLWIGRKLYRPHALAWISNAWLQVGLYLIVESSIASWLKYT